MWLRLSLVLAAAVVTAGGCSSAPAERGHKDPVPREQVAAPSSTGPSPECSAGHHGEVLLRRLFASMSSARHVRIKQYFAPPGSFVRWWDPTVPVGTTLGYAELAKHLEGLQRAGVELKLTGFRDVPSGGVNAAGGRWFDFRVHARRDRDALRRVGSGKGAVDCVTGKLMVVVIGW